MRLYRLKGHTPVLCEDPLEWGQAMSITDRHVANDCIETIRVSTMFLGIDLSFEDDGPGPPILFETMIFGGPFEEEHYQTRCSTWDEALVMHETARQKVLALK